MKRDALIIILFFCFILLVLNIILISKNNILKNTKAEKQLEQTVNFQDDLLMIDYLENYLETPGLIKNIPVWYNESKLLLSNIYVEPHLLIWVTKKSCSSCIFSILEDLKKIFPKDLLNKILIIKTYSEVNNIDFGNIGLKFFYTDSPFPIDPPNPNIQVFLGIIGQDQQIKLSFIPLPDLEERTLKYLKLIRNSNVLN